MGLIERLREEILPKFSDSREKKSEKITEDGIQAELSHNEINAGINAWFKFTNFGSGVIFIDPGTQRGYQELLHRYSLAPLVTNGEDFSYEAFLRRGEEHFAMVTPKFWSVTEFEDPIKVEFAKDLLQFYRTYRDPKFEDKT